MRLAAIGLLILGALPLLVYPFLLLANVMSFAGTATGNELLSQWLISRAFLLGSTIYPIIYLISAIISIVQIVRNKGKTALTYSSLPLIYLVFLGGLFAVWSVSDSWVLSNTQDGFITQGQGEATQLVECTAPVFDSGDGFQTTGCGVFENGSVTGKTEKTTDAHYWRFTAQNSSQVKIAIKNDGKSCPHIRIFDSNGQVVEGFEDENERRSCLEGMITTSFYTFNNPNVDVAYFIRLVTPESPGEYWMKVE